MTLTELETALSKIDLSKFDNFRINKYTVILNAKKFVEVNIETLKANKNNRALDSSFDNLLNFYNIIKNEKTQS